MREIVKPIKMEEIKKDIFEYSVEFAKEEGLDNCTPIYRNAKAPSTLVDNLSRPVDSLYAGFERSVKENPDKRCMGVQVQGEDGYLSYSWYSFKEWSALTHKTCKIL